MTQRFITESPLQQLGGARELSSTLRYKLLPHMSMAAVKPSLSSPPPPWKGKPPKRTVQSFDLRVFDRERFGAYAIWLGHHFKRYKQKGEWI